MKVSVIIPTYNEEKTIEEILKRVYKNDLIMKSLLLTMVQLIKRGKSLRG